MKSSSKMRAEAETLRASGDTYRQIADKLGVGRFTVKAWLNLNFQIKRAADKRRAYLRKRAENAEATRTAAAERREQRLRAREARSSADRAERERRKQVAAFQKKVTRRLNSAKRGAEARELDFSLDRETVARLMGGGVCQRTGLVLDYTGHFGPSLDRVDNGGGYSPDNVQLVAWIYNRAKGSGSDADVLRMAASLVSRELLLRGCTLDQLVAEFEWD